MFFQVAKPLPKEEFLAVYREAVLLTQLLFAPLGPAESTADVLGQITAMDAYSSMFQQFEDLVSKRIFALRGFDDERIIASMHEYVGEHHDSEVMLEMQRATAALHQMLSPPSVVEFDLSDCAALSSEFNPVVARTAALLLHRVLTALVPTLYGEHFTRTEDGEYACAGASLYIPDLSAEKACGTRIPRTTFSPACEFSKAPFNTTSLRHGPSVKALLSALTVEVADLTSSSSPLELGRRTTGGAVAASTEVKFSLQQYHCLLDLFGASEEVREVLAHHCGGTAARTEPTVEAVRTGELLGSLNLSAHPVVCHVAQLTARVAALKEVGQEEQQQRAEQALEFAMLGIQRLGEAKEVAEEGQHLRAVQLLTEGLLENLDHQDQDSGHAESSDGLSLPCHLQVALHTSRASYLAEAGDVAGALRDVDAAIAHNAASAAAYSLRCKLRLQSLGEEGGEEGDEGGPKAAEETLPQLEQAAEDGLLAFLLAGSNDLALAAAAEEAAREASRHSAKAIFAERRRGGGGASGPEGQDAEGVAPVPDNLPRSWLVASYFGAYEPLSSALSVYVPDETNDGGGSGAVAPVASESSDNIVDICDIDEEDLTQAQLPAVPAHLRDSEGPRERDAEAYALLLCLVEGLETVTYDSAMHAESSNVTADAVTGHFEATASASGGTVAAPHIAAAQEQSVRELARVNPRGVTHVDTATGKQHTVRSVADSLLGFAEEAGVDALARTMAAVAVKREPSAKEGLSVAVAEEEQEPLELVASGVCTAGDEVTAPVTDPVPIAASSTVPATPHEEGSKLQVQACRYYTALLSVLRGQSWSSDAEQQVASAVPAGVRGAVGGFNAAAVAELTGVTFNADGSVASVDGGLSGETHLCADEEDDEGSEGSTHRSGHGKGAWGGSDEDEDHEGGEDGRGGWEGFGGGGADFAAQQEFLRRAFGMGGGSSYEGSEGAEDSDSEGSGDEGSEWETVSGSEEGDDGEDREEEKEEDGEHVAPPRTGATKQSQKGKEAASGRKEEVAEALRQVEEHLRAHHLEEAAAQDLPAPPSASAASPTTTTTTTAPAPPRAPAAEPSPLVRPASEPIPTPTAVELTTQAAGEHADAQTDNTPVDVPQGPPTEVTREVAHAVHEPSPEPAEPLAVSHRLRARLLSVCASLAYLAGDATGAVQCLRASVRQDPTLLDSQIKLGSLLVDMDEMKEASKLLKAAHKAAPANYIAHLHLAEMYTHKSSFDQAAQLLRKARRLAEEAVAAEGEEGSAAGKLAAARAALLGGEGPGAPQRRMQEYSERVHRANHDSLANIIALLGINLFRQHPTRPEMALHLLQNALATQFAQEQSPVMLLCAGEVYSQAGDMVTALDCFQKAQRRAPNNPLSYVNAARTYQQLNQMATAERHLQAALLLDPAMAMVRVDLAQNLLLSGHAAESLQLLEEALQLAKQVSEIRDVLTARAIARMQASLEERGLYCSSGSRSMNS